MDTGVGGSFRVHLQSLRDFAQRLEEQLEVVQRSTRSAAVLNRAPGLPLGAFAEAFSLSDDHSDAVRQSATLLEKVARSIDFTRSVTALVAQRYEALNAAGAQGIGAVGAAIPSVAGVATPPAGVATPSAGSLASPEVIARFTVPVPPSGGTVYYYNGSTTVPVNVTVQVQDA
jgi:hypothetical protein